MKRMNFKDWWNFVGTKKVTEVLEVAGCRLAYARQFRIGMKSPGRETAIAIIDAARRVTPGWEPDLELMLRGVPRSGKGSQLIMPSAEFLKSTAGKAPAKRVRK